MVCKNVEKSDSGVSIAQYCGFYCRQKIQFSILSRLLKPEYCVYMCKTPDQKCLSVLGQNPETPVVAPSCTCQQQTVIGIDKVYQKNNNNTNTSGHRNTN